MSRSARVIKAYHRARYESRRDEVKARVTKWCKENPDARRAIVRRYKDKNYVARKIRLYEKYGINFLRLFAYEKGECAICQKPARRLFELVLDHDHKTGKGRGLLCQKHNIALGLFSDSPALLSQAIAYLSRNLPAEVFDITEDAPDPAPRCNPDDEAGVLAQAWIGPR